MATIILSYQKKDDLSLKPYILCKLMEFKLTELKTFQCVGAWVAEGLVIGFQKTLRAPN